MNLGHGSVMREGDTMTGDLNFVGARVLKSTNDSLYLGGGGASLLILSSLPASGKVCITSDGKLFPVQGTTGSPPAYVNGGLYFATDTDKLYVGGAAGWEAVTSA